MTTSGWLPLTDFSSKYRVSVSTLRRRIKADQVQYRLSSGKYFLRDAPPSPELEFDTQVTPAAHRPSKVELSAGHLGVAFQLPHHQIAEDPTRRRSANTREATALSTTTAPMSDERGNEEPIISTATKLLTELKKAYMSILQEKEAQLLQLKEEVVDLKTLVRVLEEDNERMKRALSPRRE